LPFLKATKDFAMLTEKANRQSSLSLQNTSSACRSIAWDSPRAEAVFWRWGTSFWGRRICYRAALGFF